MLTIFKLAVYTGEELTDSSCSFKIFMALPPIQKEEVNTKCHAV